MMKEDHSGLPGLVASLKSREKAKERLTILE